MNEEMITRIATAVAVAILNVVEVTPAPVSSVGTEEVATKPRTPRKTSTKSVRSSAPKMTKAEKKAHNRRLWNTINGHTNYAKSIVETDPTKALESLRKATSLLPEGWSMPRNVEATYALLNQ